MSKEIIKWDLSDFYKDINDPNIEKDIQDISTLAVSFEQEVKSKLKDPSLTSKQLSIWFKEYESISERVFYLQLYSELLYQTNNLNNDIKSFHSKIDEFNVKIQQNLLFFNLELNTISDNKFQEFLKAPELSSYSHALKFNRLKKVHQLSEKEEQIILMKDITGVNGFIKLYNELKSSFIFDFEVDGEVKKLTEAELFAYMYQQDKDLRYKALQKMMKRYEEYEMIFTHIFNNVFKDWDLETKRKNFPLPISRRNLENEVSDESVEILGKVTTESYNIVEKYYNLKRNLLNLPELHMSDLYAPVGQSIRTYSYEEVIKLIEDADEKFYPEFKDIIETMVNLEHIDATPRKGKNRGAFCSNGKLKRYPFVFVNFTGTSDLIRTLAHELGHAFHAYYIQRDQNFINIEVSLVMAEIASVFNEILIFDYIMNTDLSKEEKIALLCDFIESKFATSHRQNAFYRFEKKIHELSEIKLPTTEEIKDLFVKEMKLMFGNSMVNIKEDYAAYCFIISHFLHVPFYVYAYNMSNLLVLSIYQLYLEQKEEFIPKYLKLLSLGSSLSPEEILAALGITLDDPSFWQKGITYLSDKIKDLEDLIKNK
ncbi:MAG: M3 family oligoendopeptidase [Candidatus Thorarchaeota archaeon]